MSEIKEIGLKLNISPYTDLFYTSDAIYISGNIDKTLKEDLINKDVMVYAGWYKFLPSWKYPVIYLIGRGKRYGKFFISIGGFRPYCYIVSDKGKYKSIFGENLEKIEFEFNPPDAVRRFRVMSLNKGIKQPYEADITFVRRFLIDTYGIFKSEEPPKLNILLIDVETCYPISNDLISVAINKTWNDEIICINKYDCDDNYWYMAAELLKSFIEADVVSGWNIKFDIDIIIPLFSNIAFVIKKIKQNRYSRQQLIDDIRKFIGKEQARKIVDALLESGIIKEENGILDVAIDIPNYLIEENLDPYKLTAIMDMKDLTKKMIGRELKSWSLENAGRELVGVLKHLDTKYVKDLDRDGLITYNVIDVIIPEEIEREFAPITYHIYLAWMLQCKLEDTEIHSVVNDIVMLNEYKRHNIVLPSKNLTKQKSGYKAAEPFGLKGVYDGVVAIDLKAAYPSCVLALNASIETMDKNGELVAANGIRFNKNKSVFVEALKRIMKAREEVKNKLNEVKDPDERQRLDLIQRALKTQAAAFSHGIFGYQYSRLFYEELAEAITSTVRSILNNARKALEENGYKVIYAHTDSLYVVGKKEDIDKILDIVNSSVKEYVEQKGYMYTPTFEFKDYYIKGYIHSPARNVMVKENGEWSVTGMNLIRSDAPDFLQDLERTVLQMFLDRYDKDKILDEVIKILNDIDSKSPDYLGIPKPLKKDPNAYKVKSAHIKAVLNSMEEYGLDISVGEKFLMLPVKKKDGKKGYIAFKHGEWPGGYEIDYLEYIRSVVIGKLAIMLNVKAKELKNEIEAKLKFK